jgi:hypothetical protein
MEEALEMLAQLAKEASPRPRPPPLFP